MAVLVRELSSGERKGQHKVSLRATDDDVDVSIIARAQGGGGHRRAAGFSTTARAEELIVFLREAIAAQLHPLPDGQRGRHACLSGAGARLSGTRGGEMDGVLLIDKPAGHQLARRRRRGAPLAGGARRPGTPARSTRSRPGCCSCSSGGPRRRRRADGAAQAL